AADHPDGCRGGGLDVPGRAGRLPPSAGDVNRGRPPRGSTEAASPDGLAWTPNRRRGSVQAQHPEAPTQPTEMRVEHEQDLGALRALSDPSQLTALTLANCHLSDLEPLAELPRLTRLDLNCCDQVREPSPLARLPHITALHLIFGEQISNLGQLAE